MSVYDEYANLGRQYFSEVTDPAKREQIVEDLQSVGVTPDFFSSVHLATSAGDVLKWVRNFFRVGENVIIFGVKGFGKTQIVEQAAASLGLDLIVESTATKLPEDYGGIPLASYRNIPDKVLTAKIREEIRQRKLNELVEQEVTAKMEKESVVNPRLLRADLTKELAPKVTVSDDEVQAELSTYAEDDARKQRIIQEMSAPDWVYEIQDNWLLDHKKTVFFLDELNQARPEVQNALFDFVQKRRFGNKKQYSLADAVIYASAGNFPRENPSVSQIPGPLLDRFKNIIVYEGDWASSIQWNKESYLAHAAKYPHLAELLADSSVTDEAWQQSFSTPRSMEGAISLWAQLEKYSQEGNVEALKDYDDLDSIGLSERNKTSLASAIKRFLADIGVPAFSAAAANARAGSSMSRMFIVQQRSFTTFWKTYADGRTVDLDGTRYRNTDIGPVDFFKKLFAKYPLITKETLANAVGGPDNESCLDTLKKAGISPQDLPKK